MSTAISDTPAHSARQVRKSKLKTPMAEDLSGMAKFPKSAGEMTSVPAARYAATAMRA